MSTSLTTAEQLSSLASAIKNYADARGGSSALPVAGASTLGGVKIGAGLSMAGDTLSVNWAGFTLDTLPSTVNGGLWIEGGDSVPAIKLFYGGSTYKIPTSLADGVSFSPASANIYLGFSTVATINVIDSQNESYAIILVDAPDGAIQQGNSLVFTPKEYGDYRITVQARSWTGRLIGTATLPVSVTSHYGTATGLSVSLTPQTATINESESTTSTVTVTSTNNGTYTIQMLGTASDFATLSGNIITVTPPGAGTFQLIVTAQGMDSASATLTVIVNANAPEPEPDDVIE